MDAARTISLDFCLLLSFFSSENVQESRAIRKVAGDFPTEKEERHRMEDSINLIRDSLRAILDAFLGAHASRCPAGPGRPDNRMAEAVDGLGVDWARLRSLADDLPIRYPLDYGQMEKF